MKKKVKYLLIGAVVLTAAVYAAYAVSTPAVLPLTQVTAKTAELSFTEQGTFVADSVVRIYPLTQGKLLQVNVARGQTVKAGDILCVIDPEPLLLQTEQLRIAVEGYEAQMRDAAVRQLSGGAVIREQLRLQDIRIEQSERDLSGAAEELSRAEFLFLEGSISEAELENARAAAESLEAALQSVRQQRSVIEAGYDRSDLTDYYNAVIRAEQANIARLEKDIENCNIRAGVDGVVTDLAAGETNYITGAAPVAEITVVKSNIIETYVSTKDVDSVNEGDRVLLTLKRREGDAEFSGTIAHIDSMAEIKYSPLGVEERKVKLRIIPNLDELNGASFGAGFTVEVNFIVYSENNKFTAPKTALFKDNGRDMLWLVKDGRLLSSPVVSGPELRTEYIIESGVSDGDFIVTDANNKDLKDGLKVKAE